MIQRFFALRFFLGWLDSWWIIFAEFLGLANLTCRLIRALGLKFFITDFTLFLTRFFKKRTIFDDLFLHLFLFKVITKVLVLNILFSNVWKFRWFGILKPVLKTYLRLSVLLERILHRRWLKWVLLWVFEQLYFLCKLFKSNFFLFI